SIASRNVPAWLHEGLAMYFEGHDAALSERRLAAARLFVPIFLEQALKRAVVASGRQKLLMQRVYRIPGHCGFSQQEMTAAFDDLVKWVHQGVKPVGDDVEGDLSNAGMKFTQPLRPNDPGGLRVGPGL
ncbi:MAG TPA: hypothetical protein VKB36_04170, partial [Vicinamibacterales bacterium]|nr:hypothetical protein [Vicinamibacterales bacterium]